MLLLLGVGGICLEWLLLMQRPESEKLLDVLVVFVAVGPNKDRSENVRRSLAKLPDNTRGVRFSCIIFDYSTFKYHPRWAAKQKRCQYVRNTRWTYAMFLRSLAPSMISAFDYVMIAIDDVVWQNFDVGKFMQLALKHNLDIASPSVDGAVWPIMSRTKHSGKGRLVNHMEFFVVAFSRRVWPCVWSFLDMEFEGAGGHIDFFVFRLCPESVPRLRAGVYDVFAVSHLKGPRVAEEVDTIALRLKNMRASWKKERNIILPEHGETPDKVLAILD